MPEVRRAPILAVLVATVLVVGACGDADAPDANDAADGATLTLVAPEADGDPTNDSSATVPTAAPSTSIEAAPDGEAPGPTDDDATTADSEATSSTGSSTGQPLSTLDFELDEIAALEQPLDLATRPGDNGLYFAEKTGRVRRVVDGDVQPVPWLDLSSRISTDGERGLLGVSFTPDGFRFVASFTDLDGNTQISSWAVDEFIDLDSEVVHFTTEQPFSNHNGGDIAFGPDGYLYVGLGDGGSANDPLDAGQDTTTLLGAMLRIELTGTGYNIPDGNPLAVPDRPELWLWGLRNPWRFSFDRMTGDLWIGDVGQGSREEIDVVSPEPSVRNLGWNRYEGSARFDGDELAEHHLPIVEYGRDDGVSVTGGFVYRGADHPELDGAYLYADFGGGWVRALRRDGAAITEHREILRDVGSIAAFGEDQDGELYVLTLNGPVYRLRVAG